MKKLLVVAVIILFLSVSVIPSTGTIVERESSNPISNGNTLYVGGSGPGNYSTIQEAIDNASDGDIVFVYDDSSPYYENVVVDKSINLIGEDKHTTVIDGKEKEETDVIIVKADRVTIQGFTIQNGTHTDGTGCGSGIKVLSHNTIIRDNIITDNKAGIQLGVITEYYSNNSLIEGNIITENHEIGVYIVFSYENIVTQNIIALNKYHGVFLCWLTGNNLVTFNNISFHEQFGIGVLATDNNTIQNNIIINNGDGVIITSSCQNKILENNIFDNKRNAMVNGETIGLILNRWLDNTWNGNYWGKPRLLPKPIPAICSLVLPNFIWMLIFKFPLFIVPLVVFDWHPAKEPYDIDV